MGGIAEGLFGGSSSSGQSSSRLDSDIKAEFMGNLDRAKGVADNLGARQIAGFGSDFESGAGLLRAGANEGFDAVDAAAQRAGQTVTASQVAPGSFLGGDISR